MKKIIVPAIILLLLSYAAIAQDKNISVFGGYGSQGAVLGVDVTISHELIEGSQTRLYFEGGLEGHKFANENLRFRNQNYPSDSRVFFAGVGVSQEFQKKNLRIAPFLGLRYAYARFTDKALVDAIGEFNLIRTWNGKQVGPSVENGYGDAVTIDVGLRLGYHVTPGVEIFVSGGFSPLKFSTAGTLFGKYWGESPYPNDYHINYSSIRGMGGLRLHF